MRLHYDIYGQGKPLVFLHGFLEDSTIWQEIWPHFKKIGYRIILIDLPCHGNSRFTGSVCPMADMAMAVNNILSTYKIENPTIIGHSMGGYVGLELLRELDAKLILLHSNFWEDSEQKREDRNRVIQIVERGSELFIREAIPALFAPQNRIKCALQIDELIRKALQIPAAEIAAATAGMRDRRASHDVMNNSRVSIIQGDSDPIISLETMREECEQLDKTPQVDTLKNCGHMSIWEQPIELVEIIKNHLD